MFKEQTGGTPKVETSRVLEVVGTHDHNVDVEKGTAYQGALLMAFSGQLTPPVKHATCAKSMPLLRGDTILELRTSNCGR